MSDAELIAEQTAAELKELENDPEFLRERIRLLDEQLSDAKRENRELRIMVAYAHAGMGLYTDDGELQDTTRHPFIDWKRDPIDEIQRKIAERNLTVFETAQGSAHD